MKNIVNTLIWIISFQIIGLYLGQLTRFNIDWYHSIPKSSITPPDIIFPIVWSILYLMLSLIGKFLWRKREEKETRNMFKLFTIQQLLNWSWTPIFFHFHLTGWSLLIISVLVTLNVYLLIALLRRYKYIAYAIIPYFAWLLFAAYLNFMIWKLT